MRTIEEQSNLENDFNNSIEIVKNACENNGDLSKLFLSFWSGQDCNLSRYCNFDKGNKNAFFELIQLRDNPCWSEQGLSIVRNAIEERWGI